jgi:pseudouridine synthase
VKPAPERVVIVVNKPKGYLSACHRGHEEGYLVTELVDLPVRLFPVGRLDRESEGLLLLTNDGDLTLRLTHPRYEVEKEYEVELEHVISPEALARLRQGVELEDGPAKPRQVKRLGARRLRIVMAEGRKREVRRMLAAVGLDVVRLVRVRVAGLELGGLGSGKWRRVTDEELEQLRAQGLQAGEKG